MRRLSLFLALLLLPTLALADPVVYSPPPCEFEITFPEDPYSSRRCDDTGRCYDLTSYTKVYELSTTVNFRAHCNKSDSNLYKQYSGKVMKAALKGMTKRSVVNTYETSYREEEHYKQAGLVGEGQSGLTPTIYIAQLWIGKNSVMSVEAELIGESFDAADTLFSDILKSVRFIEDEQETETEEPPEAAEEESNPEAPAP